MATTPVLLTSGNSSVDGLTIATASITPTANRAVYAAILAARGGSINTPTAAGNGLTWVQVNTVDVVDGSSNHRRLTVFRAMGASPSSGAITFTFTSTTPTSFAWIVVEVPNVPTGGTNASAATIQSVLGGPSVATVTTISSTLAALASSLNLNLTFVALNTQATVTEDANFAELADTNVSLGSATLELEWAANQTVCAPTFASAFAESISIEVAVADTASSASTLADMVGTSTATALAQASGAVTLAAMVGTSTATALAKASGAVTLGDMLGSASVAAHATVTSAGQLADMTGAATAKAIASASQASTLADMVGTSTATALAQASGAVTLAAMVGTSTATALAKLDQTSTFEDMAGSASVAAHATVTSAGALAPMTGTATVSTTVHASASKALEDMAGAATLYVVPPPPAFADYVAELALTNVDLALALDDNAATLELFIMPYVIKVGDRLPSIAGTIKVPAEIDLTGAVLFLSYRGRHAAARTVEATNDGLDADSPAVGNDEGLPTVWNWHYDWVDGDTDAADRYDIGISAEVTGRLATFPNDGWGTFWIQEQLSANPVP